MSTAGTLSPRMVRKEPHTLPRDGMQRSKRSILSSSSGIQSTPEHEQSQKEEALSTEKGLEGIFAPFPQLSVLFHCLNNNSHTHTTRVLDSCVL